MNIAHHAWRIGMNLLLPPRCVLCEAELGENVAGQLCGACVAELSLAGGAACRHCGMPIPTPSGERCANCRGRRFHFQRVYRVGEYSGALRDAVLGAKNLSGEPIAAALGDLLTRVVEQQFDADLVHHAPRDGYDLVASVPAYWARRLRRGTNSAAVIAQTVATRLKIPAALDLLVCRRSIERQHELSLVERRKNVRGAFRKSWGYDIRESSLLLVDDVLTSGSTAHEIASVLRTAGARRVDVAVVARSLGPDW